MYLNTVAINIFIFFGCAFAFFVCFIYCAFPSTTAKIRCVCMLNLSDLVVFMSSWEH